MCRSCMYWKRVGLTSLPSQELATRIASSFYRMRASKTYSCQKTTVPCHDIRYDEFAYAENKKGKYSCIATGRRSDISLTNKSTLLRPTKEQDFVNKVWTLGFHKSVKFLDQNCAINNLHHLVRMIILNEIPILTQPRVSYTSQQILPVLMQ